MSRSLVRARLSAAAIPLPLLDDAVAGEPLGRRVPWHLLEFRPAHRCGSAGRELLPLVAEGLGFALLPAAGAAKAFHAMLPIPERADLVGALLALPDRDASKIAATWQLAREIAPGDPRVRQALGLDLGQRSADAQYEALIGLLVHGAAPAEAPAIARLLSASNSGVIAAAAAVLLAHDLLDHVDHSGALESALSTGQHAAFAAQVVELARGDLTNLGDLLESGSWTGRMGLYMLAGALVGREACDAALLLDILLARVAREPDSDGATALSWALGRVGNALGAAAATQIVEAACACRDRGFNQCVTLAALLGVHIPASDRLQVGAALDGVRITSSDLRDVVALARAHVAEAAPPWLAAMRSLAAHTAYMNPWRLDSPLMRGLLQVDVRAERAFILGAVTYDDLGVDGPANRIVGWVLARDPDSVGLLEELAAARAERAAGPVSAALLLHEGPSQVDPIVARMQIGVDVGGPLPDVPAVWGRLLRGLQERRVRAAATALLRMCPVGAAVAEAWFQCEEALGAGAGAWEKLLLFTRQAPSRAPRPHVPTLERAAVGALVGPPLVLRAIAEVEPSRRAAIAARIFRSVSERDMLLPMARGVLHAELDGDDLLGLFWPLADRSSWIPREAAGVLAQTIPLHVLEVADDVKARLVALCHDEDSDVQREARAAAARLSLDWETPPGAAQDDGASSAR